MLKRSLGLRLPSHWCASYFQIARMCLLLSHQSSLGKRKAVDEEEDINDRTKARRVESDEDSAPRAPARVIPMTTVVCLHAAVAQKSYSTEKRFLCPPPVIHVDGPAWQLRTQQFGMSVVSEQHERSFEQKAKLDEQMNASFKFLHVAGTGKAKSFHLSLDIADPPASPAEDEGEDEQDEEDDAPQGVPPRVWASFDSAPVTIISKPSKKTAKARNVTACILAGGPVSLFNRINSQTVRTKYMTIESSQLCASNTTWSAFNVNVVRRAGDSVPSRKCPSHVSILHLTMPRQ
jgi:recombining binding protein (suppressor of hairless)